jgi:hypothetical protein
VPDLVVRDVMRNELFSHLKSVRDETSGRHGLMEGFGGGCSMQVLISEFREYQASY